MPNFVVAVWEQRRQRERELRRVEAETAEHAVVTVAAAGPDDGAGRVYEAWPASDPSNNLRMVLGLRQAAPGLR